VELVVEKAALLEMASEAMRRKTGARALRAIIEQIMMDVMYEVPSSLDVKRVVVPEGILADNVQPVLMTEDMIRQAS
jgi:ATP-dependent Clp protease ATP-binding subunit ClpX